jgi:hypothetical protein
MVKVSASAQRRAREDNEKVVMDEQAKGSVVSLNSKPQREFSSGKNFVNPNAFNSAGR